MLECLFSICFVSGIYIDGGLGFQPSQLPSNYDPYTSSNDYGFNIGELSLIAEFKNNMYIEAKHISGLNFDEPDLGLNAIMIGVKINLWESK